MSQSCAHCQAEVRDTIICGRCVYVTRAHLADVAEHMRELVTVLAKDVVYTERSDGGKSTDPTIRWARMGDMFLDQVADEIRRNPVATPYAKSAADCIHELRSTLVSWCKLLWEEREIPLPRDSIPAMAAHLRGNMRILAGHEAAGELVAEIGGLAKRIMVVIDSPPYRMRHELGPCVEVIEGLVCPGPVVAYVFADGDMMARLACRRCKKEWEPEEWHKVGPEIMARKAAA